jgi:hypothetical protein
MIGAVGEQPLTYEVRRDVWDAGRTDVSLVRQAHAPRRLSLHRGPREEPSVLFHRTFRPLLELKELERYASELELVARHANDGTLGCFVDTRPHEGSVEVALYDRWFDGESVRCEELARRSYDAGDEQALVASAEFVAELQDWAERRNTERELTYASDHEEAIARETDAKEAAAAADELTAILRSHTVLCTPPDSDDA